MTMFVLLFDKLYYRYILLRLPYLNILYEQIIIICYNIIHNCSTYIICTKLLSFSWDTWCLIWLNIDLEIHIDESGLPKNSASKMLLQFRALTTTYTVLEPPNYMSNIFSYFYSIVGSSTCVCSSLYFSHYSVFFTVL